MGHARRRTTTAEVTIVAQAVNVRRETCLSLGRGEDGAWCAHLVDGAGQATVGFFDREDIVALAMALNKELAS